MSQLVKAGVGLVRNVTLNSTSCVGVCVFVFVYMCVKIQKAGTRHLKSLLYCAKLVTRNKL